MGLKLVATGLMLVALIGVAAVIFDDPDVLPRPIFAACMAMLLAGFIMIPVGGTIAIWGLLP